MKGRAPKQLYKLFIDLVDSKYLWQPKIDDDTTWRSQYTLRDSIIAIQLRPFLSSFGTFISKLLKDNVLSTQNKMYWPRNKFLVLKPVQG